MLDGRIYGVTPTGSEYGFLCNIDVKTVLRGLVDRCRRNWNTVYVQEAPDWHTRPAGAWIAEIEVVDDLSVYFSSSEKAFDHIEENGLIPSLAGEHFFLLEVDCTGPFMFDATLNAGLDMDNSNFGECRAEVILHNAGFYTLIVPEPGGEESASLLRDMRKILSNAGQEQSNCGSPQ